MSKPARLVLEIEVPGFFVQDIDPTWTEDAIAEAAEEAMQLASESVGLTFATYEGDNPRIVLRAIVGRVARASVRR